VEYPLITALTPSLAAVAYNLNQFEATLIIKDIITIADFFDCTNWD
jgi:hypothetical protein